MRWGVSPVPPRPSPAPRAQNGRPTAVCAGAFLLLFLHLLAALDLAVPPSDLLPDTLNTPMASQRTPRPFNSYPAPRFKTAAPSSAGEPPAPSLVRPVPVPPPTARPHAPTAYKTWGACPPSFLALRPRPALKTGGRMAVPRARCPPSSSTISRPPPSPSRRLTTSPTPSIAEDVPMDVLGPSIRIPGDRSSHARPHAPAAYKTQRGVSPVPPRPLPRPALKTGGPTAVRAGAFLLLFLHLLAALDFPVPPSTTSPTPSTRRGRPMDVLGPSIRIPAPRFKTAAPVVRW
ncbi:uncharacterized protein BXZ73DRAFT_108843 [Epithele typhae]|uniref:uncharacterized protein n=1 Tax=Epithele typhae TaxID=378194 RepID=UPI002007DEB2|nr:uncharacterized protein BXZ73DRAFT_108843 [Epithele typhae]KAH9910528.1 hypothetical protein BXZ73DRAFT_108843 [Epithele typhae]